MSSATDEQLVDFLYKLGSDASMVRVRDLELQPDPPQSKAHRQNPARCQLPAERPGRAENLNRQEPNENDPPSLRYGATSHCSS